MLDPRLVKQLTNGAPVLVSALADCHVELGKNNWPLISALPDDGSGEAVVPLAFTAADKIILSASSHNQNPNHFATG